MNSDEENYWKWEYEETFSNIFSLQDAYFFLSFALLLIHLKIEKK